MVSITRIVGVLRIARVTGKAIVSVAWIAITLLRKIEAHVRIVWVTPQGCVPLGRI